MTPKRLHPVSCCLSTQGRNRINAAGLRPSKRDILAPCLLATSTVTEMGLFPRGLSWSLAICNFDRILFEIVTRQSQKRPPLVFPQI